MKKLTFILSCGLLSALFLFACGGPQQNTNAEDPQEEVSQDAGMEEAHPQGDHPHGEHPHGDADAADQTGPEYTSRYICPMHCEGSGSDSAGQCPVCGMDYVMNEDFQEGEGAAQPEGDAGMGDHKGGNG